MNKFFLFLLLLLGHLSAKSQQNIRDSSIAFMMIGASAAWQAPSGNLDERFGNNFNIGGVIQWKSKKNLLYGFEGQFLFGNTVHESNILDGLTTDQGGLISAQGNYADVILYERGFKFELKAGKIFPVVGPNKNSGLLFSLGSGLLQHKIRIENQGSSIPAIEDDYKKGYDRLTNGLSLTAFAGYINFSNNRMVNFYIGLEMTEAFTQNRRSFNFDTREQDLTKRNDVLIGLRFGWNIPIYKRSPKQYYYN